MFRSCTRQTKRRQSPKSSPYRWLFSEALESRILLSTVLPAQNLGADVEPALSAHQGQLTNSAPAIGTLTIIAPAANGSMISENQKQTDILAMVNNHRGTLPAEFVLAEIFQEGGRGAFYVNGATLSSSIYRASDGPWAQPFNNPDGIMQVTAASGENVSAPYTQTQTGYDNAIKDGANYLASNFSTYGTLWQAALHYNTGPNSLWIYEHNKGDPQYLAHLASDLHTLVPPMFNLSNEDLVSKLNAAQGVLNGFLSNPSIAAGQSVAYYSTFQTQLDNALHNLSVPSLQTGFVDFETSPKIAKGPSTFAAAGEEQDITLSGAATFTGGLILGDATNFPAEDFGTPPNIYATTSQGSSSLSSTITINVSPTFTANEISFPLFNGEISAVSYVVNAFSGAKMVATQTFANIPANTASGFEAVDIKAPNITSLTIAPTDTTTSWDFTIDSVNFNGAVQQAVPVPSTQPATVGVTFSGSGQNTTITINGSGFGNAPSQLTSKGDLDFFSLSDAGGSGSSAFTAGGSYFGDNSSDAVTLHYQSWSNNEIVINGFGGFYGTNGEKIQAGNPITLTVWNTGDTVSSGAKTSWSGVVPAVKSIPATPFNPPNLASFPTEPQLWTPEPGLEQSLLGDLNEQSYANAESTDFASADQFLNTAPASGWKSAFADVASALGPIGTAASFAGASTVGDVTEASAFWLIQQTPEYKNDVAFQRSIGELGILAD